MDMASLGFAHGVHPPDSKELTRHLPIRRMPFPEEVVLPLRQHAGKPAIPRVRPGDRVQRGDCIADADGFVSAPVHASAAGTVIDIPLWPHPDGTMSPAIRIRVARHSAQVPRPRMVPEWEQLSRDGIVKAVQDGGVVGLGGAAFPTHVKLAPPAEFPVTTIILNGAECEPYLTTDHRIMVEYPGRVYTGLRIMMRTLGATKAVIGVEKNKPDAVAALMAARPTDIDVTVLPMTVKYPQGAEKMLIHAVTGREVPSGKLPVSLGVVVQNVGSAASIAEIFETGLPLVERIVTVSGRGVKNPANLIVPVGTKLSDLLAMCGGVTADATEIVFGGPMMGLSQASLDVPILKGTTGVVVLTRKDTDARVAYPCIHCGSCLDACPMFLNPQALGELARAQRYEEMQALHLSDCMLCGSCSYVCPSAIPLAQLFQLSKLALRRNIPSQPAQPVTPTAPVSPSLPAAPAAAKVGAA
ncbi:MAG TPA: electron transport complex subunit RsxC [Gemmatimonadaceae bacterium]|nr:electron transport complex subunit RsxC [Gemmatimonadaceae bacterium]